MPKNDLNVTLKGIDELLFSTEEQRQEEKREQVQQIPIDELHPFTNHPFKVVDDDAMTRTVESIAQFGVLAPLIARPRPDGDGYEIISGHRRQYAARLAGLETLPVIVRDMDDDAATILMVDSNLQREHISPSERAFAYKMKMDAMKRTAGRPPKENPRQVVGNFETADLIGKESGESGRQVQRFIRLTNLIPELLDMVDEKKVSFNPAVELSYLSHEQQQEVINAMDDTQNAPSFSQAKRIKKLAQEGNFTSEAVVDIMGEEKKGFWGRLVEGLSKTRDNIVSGIDSIFSGFSSIDDDFYEEIEETLIMGDLGIQTTMAIVEDLRKKVKENHIKDPAECKDLLIASIKEQMDLGENAYEFENRKSVVLVIGVNGVGKTTSVGKLAGQLKDQGKKVILAAADTFRAAAIEQLTEWANRAGVDMIGGQEGADPAAVVFDSISAAKARGSDIIIVDTAGRLHNKANLMNELAKIDRVISRELPDASRETLLVLDATTGQNAVHQAEEFNKAAELTGIILTKLDGTAKGGIVIAISAGLGVPVKLVGVGEGIDDLIDFDRAAFLEAILPPAEQMTGDSENEEEGAEQE